ncbi:MAG TPA: hypothetical protein VKV23_06655 [Acidimicrobiales bacterium]|jgi:hypothetical protein|nr:hypothetical protein [Acidimicrobiales bacterium]
MTSILVALLRPGAPPDGRVTLSDIEAQLRSLGGSARGVVTRSRANALGAAASAALLVVAAAYLLGRRRGRRRASVLEIRRV